MPLAEYRRKRRFTRTPEPKGKVSRRREAALAFVIQKHDASRLHYDFRLEFDGVLKSWAVPKGPSLDPAEKRLAVQVEDHPLEYGEFEGIIPEGEYGGGTVMLWDHGTWQSEEDAAEGFRLGKLKFTLDGKKLHGGWTLVRMHTRDHDGKNWLLIKERDKYARPDLKKDITETKTKSIKSGRSLEEIAAAADKTWTSQPATTHSKADKKRTVKTVSKSPSRSRDGSEVDEIAGVRLTHPDRVLFPGQGITKRDLANYYVAVADWILPHLKDRPLALVRCPAGQGKQCFYQKHPGSSAPSTLERVVIDERDGPEEYAVVNDVAGLVSLVQIGVLEIHPWGSRIDDLERPDRLIFDLDPHEEVPWKRVVAAARELRDFLDDLGLESFVKTTGGKGLHLVVPIARRSEWPVAKQFAKGVVEAFASRAPDEYTTNMSKAQRGGKIFLDYLRNDRGSTAVAAYSTRAKPRGPVSVPLAWEELTPRLHSDHFDTAKTLKRLASLRQDPWQDFAKVRQSLTAAAGKRLGHS